ncbi:heavy-metal-associated domain-containing protein [Oecophyllibacter saccharovorans]|uniref:heavy-metal-associated domain-containing protein n=1 Tax=Oecophyllibacter saccharovorans TaxID=2558360 RepID=UPI001142AF6E|nr:cation transporter [Oecophyllibacter saccharovorans]QDH15136.1 heavy-metal-associated domain-containing protein [Oecophyllibacter saccharovorans]TPW33695.1 heavy-metal-associated domain-containing protein [Oecophyllibacter saccharovorans]
MTQQPTLIFPVTGMVCDHCVASLTKALEQVPDVTQVHVTLKPEEAQVTFNPTRTTPDALAKTVTAAIIDTGFGTTGPRN